MNNFMDCLRKNCDSESINKSVTENGAVGYKTSGKALLDLNYMLSSMRNMDENMIWSYFSSAYSENPTLAVLWLFFARDVRGGCGERRVFRVIFARLCYKNPDLGIKLLPILPVYGRWDDLVDVFCGDVPCIIKSKALDIISQQLQYDIINQNNGGMVSLCAKWLPSENTSSKTTRRKAELVRNALEMTPRRYRKTLSSLRKYIDVTEVKMSSGEWEKIEYDFVPSRAAMNYRKAFERHDSERYNKYLCSVNNGESVIHSATLYPYDIVHAYQAQRGNGVDQTLEAQWKTLPNTVPMNRSTLVVVDGSASMKSCIGNSKVSCLDVSYALGIYFAEKLSGPYRNQFITFSAHPHYVNLWDDSSLRDKLDIMERFNDCSNTDIAKVFDLILDTAVKYSLKQDELPANILIVSDGEFDDMTSQFGETVDEYLFEKIRLRWETAGYQLPRLVFWNVCSRTGTIPVTDGINGVALVSGFSPNIADMVMSGELDPYKCLVDKLMSERYKAVADRLKE